MLRSVSYSFPPVLHGAPVADKLKATIKHKVHGYRQRGITPKMVTILIDGDPASAFYARQKARIGKKLGIEVEIIELAASITQQELANLVHDLCDNTAIHGVMVELPLPAHIDLTVILKELSPDKDIDGLTDANRMANVVGSTGIYPATPLACLSLLDHYGIDLYGREVVLIGFGKTVGNPLFHGLMREGATVTVCTEHTRDLKAHLKRVSVGIVAVGYAGLITPDMVHPDLILIDAGMSEREDGSMAGDVCPTVAPRVAALTPTPGGVGTVTTTQLFSNLLHAMSLQGI